MLWATNDEAALVNNNTGHKRHQRGLFKQLKDNGLIDRLLTNPWDGWGSILQEIYWRWLTKINRITNKLDSVGLFSLSFTMPPRSWQESTEHRSTFPIRQTSSSRILIPVMQTENPMRFQKTFQWSFQIRYQTQIIRWNPADSVRILKRDQNISRIPKYLKNP